MLGRGFHVHIPVHVMDFIHSICSSNDGSYTGHCNIGSDNRVKDADDGSDEDVDIELGPGEKVKICFLFRNSHYLMEHVS